MLVKKWFVEMAVINGFTLLVHVMILSLQIIGFAKNASSNRTLRGLLQQWELFMHPRCMDLLSGPGPWTPSMDRVHGPAISQWPHL